MKNRLFLLAAALALLVANGQPQGQKTKATPKTKATSAATAVSISDLVLHGKIPEAVKLAVKSPLAAESALNSLMAAADGQIVLRKITEAKTTLDAAQNFVDACDKTGQVKNLPRDALKGRGLRLQGIVLSDQKEYGNAEATLRQALEISRKAQDKALEAGVHNNLGFALRNMERLEEAAKEFDTARQIAEEQKDDLRAGSSNFNLGEVLFQLNRLDTALAAFKRSAEQNKAASQPSIEARALFMQGRVSSGLDARSPEAIKLFQEAESIFEKLGDDRNAAWSFYFMGEHAAYSMDFKRAKDFGEKALPFLTKVGDKAGLQQCYAFLSDICNHLGDTPMAEKYKKQAEELTIKK